MTKAEIDRMIADNYLRIEKFSQAAKAGVMNMAAMVDELIEIDDAMMKKYIERNMELVEENKNLKSILGQVADDCHDVLTIAQQSHCEDSKQTNEANELALRCILFFEKMVDADIKMPVELTEELVHMVFQTSRYCQRYITN